MSCHRCASLLVVLVGCISAARTSAVQAPPDSVPPLDRVIDRNHVLAVPPGPCDVPWAVVSVARATGLPAGVELLPSTCEGAGDHDRGNDIPLLGLTVREALQKVAQLDPRYLVMESNGLLLARPVEAWADKDHFLHAPIGRFAVDDANVIEAFGQLMDLARPQVRFPWRDRQPVSDAQAKHLSVDAGATSLYGALNAIVTAHGGLFWELRYDCGPGHRPETALLGVAVLELNQGTSLTHMARWPTGPDGRPRNPCAKGDR